MSTGRGKRGVLETEKRLGKTGSSLSKSHRFRWLSKCARGIRGIKRGRVRKVNGEREKRGVFLEKGVSKRFNGYEMRNESHGLEKGRSGIKTRGGGESQFWKLGSMFGLRLLKKV